MSAGEPRRAPPPGTPVPRRVVVVSPRTRATRRRVQPVTREIDEQTQVGEVYVRTLVRTQLRLAMFVCTVVACLLGGLPLLLALQPQLRLVRIGVLPLPWLLPGVVVYPALVLASWLYVRQPEHNQRDLADLVHR